MATNKRISKYWFLIAVLVVILIAEFVPRFGGDHETRWPDSNAKYGTIPVIFFLSGLMIPTEILLKAAKQYNIHIFIQSFSLLFMPLFVKVLTLVLALAGLDEWIFKGFIISSCMPVSSSAIVATVCAEGNEAVAVINCLVGSIIGMVVTPTALLILNRSSAVVSPIKSLFDLMVTVSVPLVMGQIVRNVTGLKLQPSIAQKIRQMALLLAVFITFCDIFVSQINVQLHPIQLLVSVALVVLLQMLLLYIVFWAIQYVPNQLSLQDVKAVMFCSTHKSLSLGIA